MSNIIPIFIMGAPRSGTTFLASSIASHPNIVALPEMHYIFTLLQEELIFGELSLDRKMEILKNDFHFCSLQLFNETEELKDFLYDKSSKEIVLDLIKIYNEKYHKKNYTHWVEHSPHSHQYIEVLKTYFPNVKFIHSIRDPRAVISSTYKEPWGFKDVITGSNSWNKNVIDILSKEKLYNILTIKYEDFVDFTEKNLKNISSIVGVEYDKTMLNNDGIIVPSYFEKKRTFKGQKADSSRKNKWKNELSKEEIEHINAINLELMRKFKYLFDKEKEIIGFKKYLLKMIGLLKHRYYYTKFKKELGELYCKIS